jgi:hypothetical protein
MRSRSAGIETPVLAMLWTTHTVLPSSLSPLVVLCRHNTSLDEAQQPEALLCP